MRVFLSTVLFDIDGSFSFEVLPGTQIGKVSRRISRVATLDGGADFTDFGESQADLTHVLLFRLPSLKEWLSLKLAVSLHSRFIFSCDEGIWSGAISLIAENNGIYTLTFLVEKAENV